MFHWTGLTHSSQLTGKAGELAMVAYKNASKAFNLHYICWFKQRPAQLIYRAIKE